MRQRFLIALVIGLPLFLLVVGVLNELYFRMSMDDHPVPDNELLISVYRGGGFYGFEKFTVTQHGVVEVLIARRHDEKHNLITDEFSYTLQTSDLADLTALIRSAKLLQVRYQVGESQVTVDDAERVRVTVQFDGVWNTFSCYPDGDGRTAEACRDAVEPIMQVLERLTGNASTSSQKN